MWRWGTLMLNKNDISVYFSGHNIKEYADVAIRSFLLYYPELRDRVYYFDDESTDGTIELLDDLGVNRITWNPIFKTQFDVLFNTGKISTGGHSQMMRCEYIFKNLLSECKTRYALILDGDTATLNGEFLSNYITNGNTVNSVKGHMHTPVHLMTTHTIKSYERYSQLLFDDTVYDGGKLGYAYKKHARFHPYHVFIDMKTIGDITGLYSNLVDEDYLQLFRHQFIDVGADLQLHCIENDLPYAILEEDTFVHHWTWVSSSIRDINNSCMFSDEYVINRIVNSIKYNKNLQDTLSLIGVKPHTLFKAIKSKIRTSNYN